MHTCGRQNNSRIRKKENPERKRRVEAIAPVLAVCREKWTNRGSNPRPSVCETDALPLSYTPNDHAEREIATVLSVWESVAFVFRAR